MPVYTIGIVAQFLANVIWGSSTVVVKKALEELSPYTFVFLRMLLTVFILTPFILPKLLHTRFKTKDLFVICLSGFFGISVNIGLFFLGLSYTSAIDSSVIAATTSLFIALSAYLFLREKISKVMLIGMVISFFGIITIIIQPILENGLFKINNIFGNILILFATWAWVAYIILGKGVSKKYNSWILLYISAVISLVVFFPLCYKDILSFTFYQNLSAYSFFAIVFEAVLPTIIAYYLFSWSLGLIKTTTSALIAYSHPIVAIVSSIIFLNEKLTIPFIVGTILVVFGLFLSEAKHKEHPLHHLHKHCDK